MGAKQAVPAEPCLLDAVEDAVRAAYERNDPSRVGYLAAFWQAAGCVRLEHVRRSVPLNAVEGFLWFHCYRGKQKHARSGFQWGVPSVMFNGWP